MANPTVSPGYGPGIFGAWLCIVASLIASWTLDPVARRRDDLPREVFMVIAYPMIASGHAVYLLFKLTRIDKTSTRNEEASDLDAAFLAPATVVRTGQLLIAVLTGITIYNRTSQRRMVVIIGLSLSMISNDILAVMKFKFQRLPENEASVISSMFALVTCALSILDTFKPARFKRFLSYQIIWYALTSGLVLSALTTSATERQDSSTTRFLHFIPQTPYSITEFNQAVAFSGGLLVLFGFTVGTYVNRYMRPRESKAKD